MIVPFAPGGLTDVPARLVAAMMQEKIGQNIVVENKTGGSGVIGGQFAVRAAPDGYTLFANSVADTQNLHYIPVPYSAIDDFAMIGWIVEGPPLVLAIDAKLPYKTLAEFVADAKANPNKLSFGTSGPASSPVIALTQLNMPPGPRSSACPIAARAKRRAPLPAAARSRARLRSTRRSSRWPTTARCARSRSQGPHRIAGWDVPTMEELGYKNFDYRGFVGLAVPAKTPKPIVAFLHKHLNEVVQSATFKQRMAELGMTVPARGRQHAGAVPRVHEGADRAAGGVRQAHRPPAGRSAAVRRRS